MLPQWYQASFQPMRLQAWNWKRGTSPDGIYSRITNPNFGLIWNFPKSLTSLSSWIPRSTCSRWCPDIIKKKTFSEFSREQYTNSAHIGHIAMMSAHVKSTPYFYSSGKEEAINDYMKGSLRPCPGNLPGPISVFGEKCFSAEVNFC